MKCDIAIIGAGIVGLSTAYKILKKQPNLKVVVIEKENDIVKHQSGNNSGVIHSGVYYKPGSLRATNCINGYNQLLKFCKEEDIKHEICGKIIVATKQSDLIHLKEVFRKGEANGLKGLKLIGKEEMREIEPHVNGIEAIKVPQAGICDYRGVAKRLKEKIIAAGAEIKFGEKVVDASLGSYTNIITHTNNYECKLAINCAGLYADKVAKLTVNKVGLKILPFRGEYYELKEDKRNLVKHLIYPSPDPAFPWLGVHFTRMVNGAIEAGPNAVLAFRREGYKKSDFHLGEFAETVTYSGFLKLASKYWKQGYGEFKRSFFKSAFTKALQGLIPEITEDDLVPGGAGVRALCCYPNGMLLDDYIFAEAKGVINVLNAPSPAATSSLSIGDTICEMALNKVG